MTQESIKKQVKSVLNNMPQDWLKLTTHRLDIYNEEMAKVDFLNHFEKGEDLESLPTAYDYIRLGHPLSCVLEWTIAGIKNVNVNNVISFSSQTMPLLAILRKSHFEGANTQVVIQTELPDSFNAELLKTVYGYDFEIVDELNPSFKGCSVVLTSFDKAWSEEKSEADFMICLHKDLGSVVIAGLDSYVSEIQHVRRRESIAMTPRDCFKVLQEFVDNKKTESTNVDRSSLKSTIKEITNTKGTVSIGSCGLSAQYAIMMGLVDHAQVNH
ncbi:MAG: cystathionine beta-synthase, partial [Bacteriovoracaceae bacterium]|nr:cystathionine beta-synthase [Bacteriovoracaceae bacterium]